MDDTRLVPVAAIVGNDDAAFIVPQEEHGYSSGGGFCDAPPSRTPFRMFADFTGADRRFREPVMSGEDGSFRSVEASKPFEAVGGEITVNHTAVPQPTADTIEAVRNDISRIAKVRDEGLNPKELVGAKKPDLSVVPPVALMHLATAMMNGAGKYGPFNWRDQPISYRPYLAAAMRHCASCLDGEDFSQDTVEAGFPVHHLGHVMACCAIVLDAIHCGTIKDNRPKVPGQTGDAIELYNREKRLLPAA